MTHFGALVATASFQCSGAIASNAWISCDRRFFSLWSQKNFAFFPK
ncbi:hypothetical protein [Chroococcidiopsis sp.]